MRRTKVQVYHDEAAAHSKVVTGRCSTSFVSLPTHLFSVASPPRSLQLLKYFDNNLSSALPCSTRILSGSLVDGNSLIPGIPCKGRVSPVLPSWKDPHPRYGYQHLRHTLHYYIPVTAFTMFASSVSTYTLLSYLVCPNMQSETSVVHLDFPAIPPTNNNKHTPPPCPLWWLTRGPVPRSSSQIFPIATRRT